MTTARTDWTGVAFGTLLGALAAYQQFKLPPALPLLLDRYGYDTVLAGGFMSVYALMGLMLSFAVARGAARHGWPRVVAGAALVMVAGNALGLAWPASGAVMMASRAFEGAAYAAFAFLGPVLANASGRGREMPLIFALTAAWIPVGQIAAGLLAAAAPDDWRHLWWGGIAATALVLLWTVVLGRRGRFAEALFASSAAPLDPARPTGRERAAMMLVAGIFFFWSMQYFAFMTWLPQYLVAVQGFDAVAAIRGYLVPVATLLVFVAAAGFILRAGAPIGALLVTTLVLQGAAWLLIKEGEAGTDTALLLVLWGIGAGITPTCLFGMPATIAAEPPSRAHAFAVLMTGRNLGVLAGPLALAAAIEATGSWAVARPLCAALALAAAALALVLAGLLRRRR